MRRSATGTVQTLMQCGHLSTYTPVPKSGDVLWCYSCENYRAAIGIRNYWIAKCHDCQYSKSYGADKLWAMIKGAHHSRIKRHKVSVYDKGLPNDAIVIEPADVPLFVNAEEPPY